MSLPAPLLAALSDLETLCGAEAAQAVQAALEQPPRLALLGRQGSGRSTLLNRWLGEALRPTGLGGVTRQVAEVEVGPLVLLDTPAVEAPEAVGVLGPLVAGCDGAVWVVDGLQPLPASEREAMAALIDPALPLWVVVGRADLLEQDDRQGVLQRVRHLCAPYRPQQVVLADLRRDVVPLPSMGGLPPRRQQAVLGWLSRAREALDALPPLLDPGEAEARVREAVRRSARDVEAQVVAAVGSGEVGDKLAARRLLDTLAHRLPQAVAEALRELPEGERPLPAAGGGSLVPAGLMPEPGALQAAIAGLAGAEGALRTARATLGRWLLDAEASLADAFADGVPADLERARRVEVARRLAAARAWVEAASSGRP